MHAYTAYLIMVFKAFFTKLFRLSNMYANEWSIRCTLDGYYVGLILPSCQTQSVKVINQCFIHIRDVGDGWAG